MWHITPEQQVRIDHFLDHQGLSFKPLREEMTDHMHQDLKFSIEKGLPFEEAFKKITSDIPENHFKTIQKETMEAIQKRFTASRIFSIASIVLLFVSSAFKMLHLPGAAILLISSLVAIAMALVISIYSGIKLYKEKRGSIIMLITVGAILLFYIGWSLYILNFSQAYYIRVASVLVLSILFPALTIYFQQNLKSEDNILIFLHKKHNPGIERYLLTSLSIAVILRLSAIFFQYPPIISNILFVLVACGAGLQFYALNWHPNLKTSSNKNLPVVLLIISFYCFLIPTLGSIIPLPARVSMIVAFYFIAGTLAMKPFVSQREMWIKVILLVVVVAVFSVWSLIRLEIIPQEAQAYVFNLPVLLILVVGLFYSNKLSIFRMYMIMVIAHYVYEYPEMILGF